MVVIMNLLEILKRNENIRKIFGKREIVIIEKQLLGVKLTQSEKNRLSRDIRKKFDAIKELSKIENDLKYGSEIKKIINETLDTINDSKYIKSIKKIYLYGSTADNTRTLNSDIDIAVEFLEITEKEGVQFRIDMMKNLNNKIDIQVYNLLPQKIKDEILIKGKIIYEQPY